MGFHDYLLSVLRRAGLNMMLEIPQFKQNEGSGLVCNMFVTNLLVLLRALPASPCAPPPSGLLSSGQHGAAPALKPRHSVSFMSSLLTMFQQGDEFFG